MVEVYCILWYNVFHSEKVLARFAKQTEAGLLSGLHEAKRVCNLRYDRKGRADEITHLSGLLIWCNIHISSVKGTDLV